jgi:uncharacterized protein (DUF1501 family)
MMQAMGLAALGTSSASWFAPLAQAMASQPGRRRHCILLWMNGGPSQTDTFDMKPHHPNGGAFKEIATSVPGLRFSEHLPKLAQHGEHLAVIRSLSTKEGDHARGAHVVRTGYAPVGDVAYPAMGSVLSKELAHGDTILPAYVSIAPQPQLNPVAFGPGFLGPRYAPAIVGGGANPPADNGQPMADLRLENIAWPDGLSQSRASRRMDLWRALEGKFLAHRRRDAFAAHHTLYKQAAEMMRPEVRRAFDLGEEPEAVRERYGNGLFGQGCLLARRLVERGVPFVEVALGEGLAWDTHADNFRTVATLSAQLDAGWSSLMIELGDRGLLDSTTIVWMGEFGRTPIINSNAGRDHFPNAWSCVLAGGGIAGGQAYGRTSPDGMAIEAGNVQIGDVLATLCAALGVPPDHENVTPMGRPIRVAEGTPIRELLA